MEDSKDKPFSSVLDTNSYIEDITEHRKQIINVLYGATGLPFNRIYNEYGDLINHAIKNHYTDRQLFGAIIGQMWANHLDLDNQEFDE